MSLGQIAKDAGVSVATVSRVLNRSTKVRPRTAQQVWRTIESIKVANGARPSNHISGHTGNVGMLVLGGGRISGLFPVFLELVSGIADELRRQNLRMVVIEIPDTADVESHLRPKELDGVIALFETGFWHSEIPERISKLTSSVWVMGPQLGPAVVDHVMPQNLAIGEMAFNYLRSRGCHRVAVASLAAFKTVVSRVSVMRHLGFASAARAAGFEVDFFGSNFDDAAERVLGQRLHLASSEEQLADLIVERLPKGAGIFFSTDQETARMYPLLLKRGIQPEIDYFQVSCDNEPRTLAIFDPCPATIDINPRLIGREAVRRLMQRIAHPNDPPLVIEVPPRLVASRSR